MKTNNKLFEKQKRHKRTLINKTITSNATFKRTSFSTTSLKKIKGANDSLKDKNMKGD